MSFKIQDGITKALEERIEEFEELQKEYDELNRRLEPVAKSERLEELSMKVQLILSLLMKVQRNIYSELDDISSYMYKSDLERALEQTKDYMRSYQGTAFGYAEVLRSLRVKIENLYDLQKLSGMYNGNK